MLLVEDSPPWCGPPGLSSVKSSNSTSQCEFTSVVGAMEGT